MVRQIDIAKKLGVSLAVVSRALSPVRGKSNNLSVNTVEKIRQAAREMGYRKNPRRRHPPYRLYRQYGG